MNRSDGRVIDSEEQIRELIENVKEKKKKALEIAESLYLTCSYDVFKEAKRAAEEYGRHLISLIAAHEMFLRSLEYLKEEEKRTSGRSGCRYGADPV